VKLENLEKEAIKFITESIPMSLKFTWPIFFLTFVTGYFVFEPIISKLPVRYGVSAIIKTGKIEKRSYKSRILDDLDRVVEEDAMEHAVGLSSSDLEILLRGKYMNHRSKLKKISDEGPFLTEINVPRESKLILINAESVDIKKGKDIVGIVIKDLQTRFNKEKKIIEEEVQKRLDILVSDHKKIQAQLKRINLVSEEIGFSPVLNQQKNELIKHETKLRYMLIDIKGQLNSDKLSQFKVLSLNSSKYPVTIRKAVYYVLLGVLSLILQVLVTLFVGAFNHTKMPPVLSDFMLEKKI
jgi:hypothetical protein